MRIRITIIFLTALVSSNAQSNNTPPPYWDKLQKCESLNGEYGHVKAFEHLVKKGTRPTLCFVISGHSKEAFLELRRNAITDNDRVYISEIPKPWLGVGTYIPSLPFKTIDTDHDYPATYIALTEELGYTENEKIAINISFNVADHDREFFFFYNQDEHGAFLGSISLFTEDEPAEISHVEQGYINRVRD
ncbi:hypothetical protein L2737_08785 [Shewanella electrodiphila]|uniref:Uncharacterized protein n=1 Tax=Shewanella electrodiphila TaxID=934143 RepID=A0ABT0KNI8_9GAMM|nr:hypothetical protein [Shewanella electrodiphila]MCL1045420.1 hypothetical protein [Shewanella electrodiphila]